MKTKKVLPLILLLFVAIMLFSVGMIAKEYGWDITVSLDFFTHATLRNGRVVSP